MLNGIPGQRSRFVSAVGKSCKIDKVAERVTVRCSTRVARKDALAARTQASRQLLPAPQAFRRLPVPSRRFEGSPMVNGLSYAPARFSGISVFACTRLLT